MAKDRRVRWTRDAKLKRLARVPLFAECSKGDLSRIAALADELDVSAGHVLIRQGEDGHQGFVILSGKARVSFRGKSQTLMLGTGDAFGEMALLQPRGKRTATVTAETDMDLLVLTSRQFATLLDDFPTVTRKILAAVADRLREAEKGQRPH